MKIVLQVSGGIGKSIIATAVCSAIKKHYKDAELSSPAEKAGRLNEDEMTCNYSGFVVILNYSAFI